MLAHVQTDAFALATDAHGYHLVDYPIEEHTHCKGIGKNDDDGQEVVQEHHETLPRAGEQTLLDKYAREDRAHYAAGAVREDRFISQS